MAALTGDQLRDLLAILEDRHGRKSTLITSQLPIEHWHEWLGEATLADAIMLRYQRLRRSLRTIRTH
jgi:DNA replication protein DnaC